MIFLPYFLSADFSGPAACRKRGERPIDGQYFASKGHIDKAAGNRLNTP
jgi:hypothetical protein